MDAWEADAFGNDTANDWLAEVVETSDLQMIHDAFDTVLGSGDENIELQAGEEAYAAAEIVAWLSGHPGKTGDHGDLIEGWMENHELEFSEALANKAKKSIDRAFNHPSELREAWEESDDFDEWKSELTKLKDRLV
ncbi:DUF4259 domain-containing protein [Haloferula sp.]|uniref:DUF4259 domain-containing protein n=1 Tax=Haloferula sp. TaxID=2497595 RepID=UPI00329BFAD0